MIQYSTIVNNGLLKLSIRVRIKVPSRGNLTDRAWGKSTELWNGFFLHMDYRMITLLSLSTMGAYRDCT